MQDPRKQKKGFDPAAFQAAAKAGQQQACSKTWTRTPRPN